jgi:cbb3-type cytochrome oxidase subunit 3
LQAAYNYNRLRKIAEEKSAEAKNAHFKSAILILALALMLLLLCIVVIYYRQKKKDFRESEKQLYDKLRKIEQGQKQRDSEAEAELRELRLLRNDVVLRLKENAPRANSNIPLKDWLSLQETIKEELPVFYSTICMVQGLRQEEINVCMLIRLQFKPKEICNITGLSPQVITNMRKRLLNKIFGKAEGGSKDFDYRISKIK